jgi:hypothetical protein
MRCASFPAVALFAGLLGLVAVPTSAQELELVPGSTVPRVQLSGEHFQIETDGIYFTEPTQSATLSRFGMVGTDLGRPLTVGDRIGILPNEDFSACRYIEDVVAQIQRGVAEPVGDMRGCPSLSVLLNPVRLPDEHVFKPFVIDNEDPWLAKQLHRPGENKIVGGLVPIYNADGTLQVREEERGVPYSPNVLDRYTVNADGSVTLYYTLPTWNPYQVFLVSSTFRPVTARRPVR